MPQGHTPLGVIHFGVHCGVSIFSDADAVRGHGPLRRRGMCARRRGNRSWPWTDSAVPLSFALSRGLKNLGKRGPYW